MSDNSDTPDIDKVRKSTTLVGSQTSINTNVTKFFSKIGSQLAIIIIYFFISGVLLYMCKIAQSNILPNDIKAFPYTNIPVKIESIQENIFTELFKSPPSSMKISFPYNNNNSYNYLLETIRLGKTNNSTNRYFLTIIENIIHFNYSFLSIALNLINLLPELVVIFLGPIIYICLILFLFGANNFYFIYLWFVQMKWFFKEYNNHSWEDIDLIINPIRFTFSIWTSIFYGFLFLIQIYFGGILFLLPISLYLFIFFTLPSYESLLNDKPASVLTVVSGVFKYYKISIMIIITYLTVSNAFAMLGTTSGIITVVLLLLAYFFKLFNFYQPIEELSTKLGTFRQAKKTMIKPNDIKSSIKGGGNRGNIIKQIQKLSSYLNKINKNT
jgi:hypothetical protein